MKQVLNFVRNLNWKFLIGVTVFSLFMAIANNIRVEESKSVEWIGGQPILEAN